MLQLYLAARNFCRIHNGMDWQILLKQNKDYHWFQSQMSFQQSCYICTIGMLKYLLLRYLPLQKLLGNSISLATFLSSLTMPHFGEENLDNCNTFWQNWAIKTMSMFISKIFQQFIFQIDVRYITFIIESICKCISHTPKFPWLN